MCKRASGDRNWGRSSQKTGIIAMPPPESLAKCDCVWHKERQCRTLDGEEELQWAKNGTCNDLMGSVSFLANLCPTDVFAIISQAKGKNGLNYSGSSGGGGLLCRKYNFVLLLLHLFFFLPPLSASQEVSSGVTGLKFAGLNLNKQEQHQKRNKDEG